MFKIGQKVICVETAYEGSTIKGKTYIVDGIEECCEVRLILNGVNHGIGRCGCCGHTSNNSTNRGHRFRPMIEDTWAEEVLQKIVEEIKKDELQPV